jgi:hypothetical protein
MKTTVCVIAVAQQSLDYFKQATEREYEFPIAHGDVIALHSDVHNRFIRLMEDSKINGHGGSMDIGKLPREWESERFLVMQLGDSHFAFYSICHERYISIDKEGNVRAGTMKSVDDPIDENETFDVCVHGKIFGGPATVSLLFQSAGRFMRMRTDGEIDGTAINAKGWEHYRVAILMRAKAIDKISDVTVIESSDISSFEEVDATKKW